MLKQWLVSVSAGVAVVVAAALPWNKWAGGPARPSGTATTVTSTPPAPPPEIDPETRIREAIVRTGGDYAKLTPEEKSRLNDFTSGHGRQFFEYRAREWKQKKRNTIGSKDVSLKPSPSPAPK